MKYFTLICVLFLFACIQDNSINPTLFVPSSSDLKNLFKIEYISEDSIRIYSTEDAHFIEPFFQSIIVGYASDYYFKRIDTISVNYLLINDRYKIEFSKDVSIEEVTDTYYTNQIELIIQFNINQIDFRSITFDVYPYKYPYQSAQIFLYNMDVPESRYSEHFADFAFAGDTLYFIKTPWHVLHEYDLKNKTIKQLIYAGAEFCAYYNGYLYFEDFHEDWGIKKFNLNTKQFEEDIGEDIVGSDYTRGLEVYNGTLYVLHFNDKGLFLTLFDLNGNYIKSIPFEARSPWGITIHDNIVYSLGFYSTENEKSDQGILRYDLETSELLPPMHISDHVDLIQIRNDYLYFSLWRGFSLYYMPLSDLNEKTGLIAPNKAM